MKKKYCFYLDSDIKAQIEDKGKQQNRSFSNMIDTVLKEYLERGKNDATSST